MTSTALLILVMLLLLGITSLYVVSEHVDTFDPQIYSCYGDWMSILNAHRLPQKCNPEQVVFENKWY